MIDLTTVKSLHVELTSRCNASCIACPRNNSGYGIVTGLEIADLSTDRFSEVLDTLPGLTQVFFCGNYGDCIASKNIDEVIDLLLPKDVEIRLHTNGSLKTAAWWGRLGAKLKDHDHSVVFALDGLEDTHHIYRQNTSFTKIINNAKAFIAAGGRAEWQFIPFAHNEHQIFKAMKMSRELGFYKFYLRKKIRYRETPRHHVTGEPLEISPWSQESTLGRYDGKAPNIDQTDYTKVEFEDCMHLSMPSVFLSFKGTLTTCCYLGELPVTSVDIAEELRSGNFRKPCLTFCGRKG